MKNFRRTLTLFILLFSVSHAQALTRAAFMAGLLEARGIDWSSSPEYEQGSPSAFMLRTGYITDDAGKLESPVTRREALRWCIESLGLSFEAEMLSDYPSGYKDADILSDFERGCLVVASNMYPVIFNKADTFRPHEALTQSEADAVFSRVRQASRNSLMLNMVRNPILGLRIYLHREGVPTGIPAWRVFAYGLDRNAANNIKTMLKTQGIESSVNQASGTYGVRTEKLEDYYLVRRFTWFLEPRGIEYKVLPVMTNTNTRIVPRYWVLLTIDPAKWDMLPMVSGNAQVLSTLSRIASQNGAKAAINGGFFAVTRAGRGYPIGALKIEGRDFSSEAYEGRGTLGWNDEYDAVFSLASGDVNEWYRMNNVIQAGPLMLYNGNAVREDEGFNTALISARHPRSAVGINEAGQWVFLVVDGRNGMHSSGATISELTDILRNLRVMYALNLDGGGSTEIIINGKIYNLPSDGYERMISYALGALSRE